MDDAIQIDDDEGVDVAAEDHVAVEEGDDEDGGGDEGENVQGGDGRDPAEEAEQEDDDDAHQQLQMLIRGNERFDLRPFINPLIPVPIPGPPPVDAEGWSQIDTWNIWSCAVTCSQLLEDVPAAYRKAWSSALSTILTRVNQATAGGQEDQIDRALMASGAPKAPPAQAKERRPKRSRLWSNILKVRSCEREELGIFAARIREGRGYRETEKEEEQQKSKRWGRQCETRGTAEEDCSRTCVERDGGPCSTTGNKSWTC